MRHLPDLDTDAAFLGEFDGVAHQIGDHLAQAALVGADGQRHIGGDDGGDLDCPWHDRAAQRSSTTAHSMARRSTSSSSRCQHAGFDLGEIQDVADQREQRLAGLGDGVGIGALFGAKLGFQQAGAPCPGRRSWACGSHGSWWRGSRTWRGWPASALSRASVSASSRTLRSVMSRPTLCTSTRRPWESRTAKSSQAIQR